MTRQDHLRLVGELVSICGAIIILFIEVGAVGWIQGRLCGPRDPVRASVYSASRLPGLPRLQTSSEWGRVSFGQTILGGPFHTLL